MKIYQNFLQTQKPLNLFRKRFKLSKMSFLYPYNALASQKNIFPKVGENCFYGGHFPLKNATS